MQSTLNKPEVGDVRLSDGCTGELETYSNPRNSEGWYRVCAASSGFSDEESQVVCKQLGCPVNGASSTFTRCTNINSVLKLLYKNILIIMRPYKFSNINRSGLESERVGLWRKIMGNDSDS